jgi:hypothetical protein
LTGAPLHRRLGSSITRRTPCARSSPSPFCSPRSPH